jgi:uncharacterized protein YutE (UPF0331/DUF86 family)
MVDVNVVTGRLRELADFISRVRSHRPPDAETLANDRNVRDLVSYNLALAVQACLDIASHLIADEVWEAGTTAAESFQTLARHEVISSELATVMGQAAGLRNILVHGYSKAVPARIHAAATTGLADLERFGQEISAWMERSRF